MDYAFGAELRERGVRTVRVGEIELRMVITRVGRELV
jgi:hypothetical protein